MPKLYTYVTEKTVEALSRLSEESGKTSSRIISELIEIGLKNYENRGSNGLDNFQIKSLNLEKIQIEYLLRILNINYEIFRCIYDKNKTKVKRDTADECMDTINNSVHEYIKTTIK